ncbi:hypothetical protein ACLQ28_30050, partial [Micromonospora sp. DT201]|uniref:hypothetical protein n=1 Tax=Micromonospora sp. DT201 TaxID=3393442 RepID=UPI003CEC1846
MTNSGTSGQAPATADEPTGDGAGSTVWYTDGTVAEFDLNGHLFRRTLPDGTVLSASDASQPADTSSEPANADPPTEPNGDAEPVPDTRILRQQTADGTVLESFDSLDRPHAGIANGNHFTITYRPDGGNLTCYEDGSSAEYDAGGGLVRQTTADGTVYSSFDAQGRPHAGVAEGSSFTIDYRAADDSSVVRYADGSAARFDAEGSVVWQDTGDGTVYSEFDAQHRPLAGSIDGEPFRVNYRPDGHSVTRYADGSVVEFGADGVVLRQVSPDGTVFSGFDGSGRPTEGSADGQDFTLEYPGNGDTITRYADGSVVEFGADGVVLRQVSPDGTVFSGFDGSGRPTEGSAADGQDFTFEYSGNGNTITRYADGSVVEFGADGVVLSQVSPDGTVFSGFDGSGRPTEGSAGGQDFSISYGPDGHSVTRYADGSVVEFGADGVVLSQVSPDGTVFSGFDGSGRPTEGSAGGQDFSISYGPDGHSVTRYADGSVVEFGADGVVLSQVSPDGTVFSGFDGSGRPTEGSAGGQDFSIS